MGILKTKIVGIDFHDYSVEITELSFSGNKKYLEAYNRTVIPAEVIVDGEIKKKEDLKLILKSMLQNANPAPIETKTVAITFPSSKVMTHIFSFPAGLSEADVKKAISFEAETVIPFSINDIYWDCAILEKEDSKVKQPLQHVLFSCINKQIADRYCELFEEIEMIPVLFSVPSDTLRNSLPADMLSGKTSLIIDVDTLAVNYLIIKNGVLKHFFSANEGGHKFIRNLAKETQLTENVLVDLKEKNKLNTVVKPERITEFLNKNYSRGKLIADEYESKHPNEKIDQIILTGEFINLPDFKKLAKDHFPKSQAIIGDPQVGLTIQNTKFHPKKDDKNKNEYVAYSIYFNNSIGSALRELNTDESNGINLLPDKLKASLDTRKRSIILSVSTILITAITLAITTLTIFQFQNVGYKNSKLVSGKSAVDKMIYGTRYQEIKGQIAEFNKEVEDLSRIDNSLFSVTSEIKKVYELMPKGIKITSLAFSDSELQFDISGVADDRDSLLKAQSNLEKAEFIKQVIAPISNYDAKTRISFQMKIKLQFAKLDKYGSGAITK